MTVGDSALLFAIVIQLIPIGFWLLGIKHALDRIARALEDRRKP